MALMEYDPQVVFRTLDSFDARALLGLGIGSLAYYVQYVSNIRVGFRERTHATPVVANMWNFADDVTYLLMFGRWFHDDRFSHWFTQAMWFGFIAWAAMEGITHYQTIRFSLGELFKGMPRRSALTLYIGAQATLLALFLFLKASVDDPIWLFMIATTQFSSIAFCIPMLLQRGSARGLSMTSARALMIAPAAFLCLFLPAVAPNFDQWPTYGAGVACIAVGFAYVRLLGRMKNKPAGSHP